MDLYKQVDESIPLVIATPVDDDDLELEAALVVHEENFSLPLSLALALPHSFPMFRCVRSSLRLSRWWLVVPLLLPYALLQLVHPGGSRLATTILESPTMWWTSGTAAR